MTRGVRSYLSTLRGGRLVVALVVALGLLLVMGRAFAAAYVEILWQAQTGYSAVFWRRVFWEWGIRAVAALAVGLLVLLNLRVASSTLGTIQIRRRFANIEFAERIPRQLVWAGITVAAVLLGLWFGAAVPPNLGIQAALLTSSQPWGLVDPVLGHDVGFYVFAVPLLASGVTLALIVTFLIFTLVTAAYAATGTLRWTRHGLDAQRLPRVHLGLLIAVFLVLLAARLWVQRYLLLTSGSSAVQEIFGFTDAQARLPALQTLMVVYLLAGAATFWGAWQGRVGPVLLSLASVAVGWLVIGQLYPSFVQRFRVEPNELARETPFIEHNIVFTRLGFGLDRLERRSFAYAADRDIDWEGATRQFEGLPVWNPNALLATYRSLEALFPYYDFADASIDRYQGPDGPVPVALAVRQIDPGGIQDPNWQNQHLRKRYVAGMGLVASLATERTPEGRPRMLLSGLSPETTAAGQGFETLRLERPEVFFGTTPQNYAVVIPESGEYLAPDSTPGVAGVDYPKGIQLTSALRTALLAWQFGDANLLFASELTDASHFVHRRLVVERALAIAPFLRFPEDPYPVLHQGRIVWVLDGFTGTGAFPLATASDFGVVRRGVRYVRNSVKVTVDAVTGEIVFYRVPVDDPIADAYEAAFPGLLTPIEEMPHELSSHLRYPRSLLGLQSRVLLQYHQETAPAFHGQQDVWSEPQELAEGTSPVPYRPEYALYALPGEARPHFSLTAVFVPAGRQNLTGTLVGRTDGVGQPELVLLDVPVADQVPGPRQIEALIEQDPLISQQFSLWRTGGSDVWTGHLHLVPVGDRFVYMEPIFLAADADAIPELRRYVVSDGTRVVMMEQLEDAVRALAGLAPTSSAAPGATGLELPRGAAWSSEALDLLERAEASARQGNWQGFGEALAELRALLQRLEGAR
ncbi:MAG: hypothetical protein FJ207_06650 [Gemmatimonadetes bacterium]|nr:hypothetical protein [Gemmatimonadota bacterium]